MTPANQPAVSSEPHLSVDETLPRLYGRGIAGCRERNPGEVGQVLMQLIGALNFEYEAAASQLFEVYDDCLHRVGRQQFEVPRRVLEGLQRAVAPSGPTVPARARSWRSGV